MTAQPQSSTQSTAVIEQYVGSASSTASPHLIFDKDVFRRGINPGREVVYTKIALTVTGIAALMLSWQVAAGAFTALEGRSWAVFFEQALFLLIAGFIIYGALVFQLSRWAYFKRLHSHKAAPREELDKLFDYTAPKIAILIPSYKEEHKVIRQALLSTALQQYQNRRVVLLVDDPPNPSDSRERGRLENTRLLAKDVQQLLAGPAEFLRRERGAFLRRQAQALVDGRFELQNLARVYGSVSSWFREQAAGCEVADQTDTLFVDLVFKAPAAEYEHEAETLRSLAADPNFSLPLIRTHYNRLGSLFKTQVEVFERKQFVNLSHEPNKAMNLNSYIGLIGKSWRVLDGDSGRYLEICEPHLSTANAPAADYIVTLDADSLLSHDYTLRLVEVMERRGNERLAVAQTPYTAVPGVSGLLERIAGATTDMQYITHQGFTGYNATYWVGANALLRRSALDDICEVDHERGFEIRRYVQDRTVIEDTESSVDLLSRGWRLYNYPERLSYSATPPDFGSLTIQRGRWANGGLIILPKLLRYLLRSPFSPATAMQGFVSVHYLISIAAVNIGTVILLLYPFEDNLRSWWFPVAALPYFALYARDLKQAGYRLVDVLRVYALNLLLLPVHLGGVFKSIQQAVSGRKIPFKRTPKVQGRTAAPALHIILQVAVIAYLLVSGISDLWFAQWAQGTFALVNWGFFTYAWYRYVGPREAWEDLRAALPVSSWWRGPGQVSLKQPAYEQ